MSAGRLRLIVTHRVCVVVALLAVPRGAATFMGQALEYEIANVVDPRFTVVAKARKSLLPKG